MGNILNHGRMPFTFRLDRSQAWDFHLCVDAYGAAWEGRDLSDCIAADIDTNISDCVWFDDVYSKGGVSWKEASNKGVELRNIGLTGMDNGLMSYQKDRISNREFLRLLKDSVHKVEADDLRLTLRKVNGNNLIYYYGNEITETDGRLAARLSGGFYQGLFKTEGYDILPHNVGEGLVFSVTLKRDDSVADGKFTLNDRHPFNKGMFLYLGTRAENKWWRKFDVKTEFEQSGNGFVVDGYVGDGYIGGDSLNVQYIKPYDDFNECDEYFGGGYLAEGCRACKTDMGYFSDEYVSGGYFVKPKGCDMYVKEGYIQPDEHIDVNEDLRTTDGYSVGQPNIRKYVTDNKFLLFDRTCDGYTTKDWAEGSTAVITEIMVPEMENGFLLFDRTCDGYTTRNIDELIGKESKKYDILADLYRNAIGFQIRDDGSVGYKYMVRDCESEEPAYRIESEFSGPDAVPYGKWCNVLVRIEPIGRIYDKCNAKTSLGDRMRITIFVDGRIRLISRELPTLNLRSLNDLPEKQEGVPFNISWGGGTQGLCDVIYLDYRKDPEYVLPLEKEFAGTFIGYIQTLKIYTCPLPFSEIRKF